MEAELGLRIYYVRIKSKILRTAKIEGRKVVFFKFYFKKKIVLKTVQSTKFRQL